MTDYPERMKRQQAFVATEPTDLLSVDALAYVDQVPVLQREAAADPYLNGQDAARRLHTDG